MSEASVSEKILSEDYADLILPVTLSGSYFLNAYEQMGGELLGNNYGMIHIPLSMLPRDLLAYVGYYNIPKLYTLLDENSLEVSGILRVRSQPLLGYTGKDIILGFLDTGINYTLPVFRHSDRPHPDRRHLGPDRPERNTTGKVKLWFFLHRR